MDWSGDHGAETAQHHIAQARFSWAAAGEGMSGWFALRGDRLNIAAAIDPVGVRQAGGLGQAASAILREAGLPDFPEFGRGLPGRAPALTRQSFASRLSLISLSLAMQPGTWSLSRERGIGCALATRSSRGRSLVMRGIADWHPSLEWEWCVTYRASRSPPAGSLCGSYLGGLRHQLFARAMVAALARA